MNESPDTTLTASRQWLGQAFEDLETARRITRDHDLPPRLACFLAHLAVEKTLKSLLILASVPFRKIHDLVGLHALLPEKWRSGLDTGELALLNPWVIDGRYADDIVEASRPLA